MAAKVTVGNKRVYSEIGDEVVSVSGTTYPGSGATMTAFRALTGMTNVAFLVYDVDGTDYAIPLLLTT